MDESQNQLDEKTVNFFRMIIKVRRNKNEPVNRAELESQLKKNMWARVSYAKMTEPQRYEMFTTILGLTPEEARGKGGSVVGASSISDLAFATLKDSSKNQLSLDTHVFKQQSSPLDGTGFYRSAKYGLCHYEERDAISKQLEMAIRNKDGSIQPQYPQPEYEQVRDQLFESGTVDSESDDDSSTGKDKLKLIHQPASNYPQWSQTPTHGEHKWMTPEQPATVAIDESELEQWPPLPGTQQLPPSTVTSLTSPSSSKTPQNSHDKESPWKKSGNNSGSKLENQRKTPDNSLHAEAGATLGLTASPRSEESHPHKETWSQGKTPDLKTIETDDRVSEKGLKLQVHQNAAALSSISQDTGPPPGFRLASTLRSEGSLNYQPSIFIPRDMKEADESSGARSTPVPQALSKHLYAGTDVSAAWRVPMTSAHKSISQTTSSVGLPDLIFNCGVQLPAPSPTRWPDIGKSVTGEIIVAKIFEMFENFKRLEVETNRFRQCPTPEQAGRVILLRKHLIKDLEHMQSANICFVHPYSTVPLIVFESGPMDWFNSAVSNCVVYP